MREMLRFTTKIKMIREVRETNPKSIIMDYYHIDPGKYLKVTPSCIPVGKVISGVYMSSFSNNLIIEVYVYDSYSILEWIFTSLTHHL